MSACIARHDGHDCTVPGECVKSMIALCDRDERRRIDDERRRIDERAERRNARTVRLIWPDDPNWSAPR